MCDLDRFSKIQSHIMLHFNCIEVIKALQSTPSPTKPVKTPKEQKTTGSDKDSHKDGPPKMTLPDHPACM